MTRKPNIGDWDYPVKKRGYELTLTALATQYDLILDGKINIVHYPSTVESDERAKAVLLHPKPIARIYCGIPGVQGIKRYHHRYINELYYDDQNWHCVLGEPCLERLEFAHVSPRLKSNSTQF